MLNLLSSFFSPYKSIDSFSEKVKRGFIFSRVYESLPDEGIVPVKKYAGIIERLRNSDEFKEIPVFETREEATEEQMRRVHTEEYIDDLVNLDMTPAVISSEIPLTYDILRFFRVSSYATLLAIDFAYRSGGRFINLSGGFHHAFADRAEGFCYLNDVAIGIEALRSRHPGLKVLVIDLDVHQGNGIVKFYSGSSDVYVFNIHQADNYPVKEQGHFDIAMPSGTGGELYLEKLQQGLKKIRHGFNADMMVYLAGADPYDGDMLGGFELTKQDLTRRDQMISAFAAENKLPVAVTLAGGYAHNVEDIVDIHLGTAKEMIYAREDSNLRPSDS